MTNLRAKSLQKGVRAQRVLGVSKKFDRILGILGFFGSFGSFKHFYKFQEDFGDFWEF